LKKLTRLLIGLIVTPLLSNAIAQQAATPQAEKNYQLRLQFSPYTYHYVYNPDHKDVVMLGLEREFPDNKLDGFTMFKNSFGQDSTYIYPWGHTYHAIGGIEPLSFKWTAGLLYGYVDSFQHEVPLNYHGFSPGLIFGLSYEFKPGWSAQLNFLGTAAVMFEISAPLN